METSTITQQEGVKRPTICRKLMVTVSWYKQGPELEHYQERGTTINSACYSAMLTNRPRPAIQCRHRGLLSKVVVIAG
jgi:hypothetical protein